MDTASKKKRYIMLFGLGFSALLLTAITQGVSRALDLEKPSHTVGFPHLLFLYLYFIAVAKLSKSEHRLARLSLVGISILGYVAVFTFWTWVLIGMPAL